MAQQVYASNGTAQQINSSNASGNALQLWASRPVSSWLSELAEAAKQQEHLHLQQLDQLNGQVLEAQKQLEAERTAKLSAQQQLTAERQRLKDLETSVAALTAERDKAVANTITYQQQLAELEGHLAKWRDSYNKADAENKYMRDQLGSKAPPPGSILPAAEVTAGHGPGAQPSSWSSQQTQPGMAPTAAAAAATALSHQQQAPQPQQQQALKNEHELVLLLCGMLPDGPSQARPWSTAEDAIVDSQLAPYTWAANYAALFGSVVMFMRQRPAVFGEYAGTPAPMFYKFPGADAMARQALLSAGQQVPPTAAAAVAPAAAAAAGAVPPAATWPGQQQLQQQPWPGQQQPQQHLPQQQQGFGVMQQQQQPPLAVPDQRAGWANQGWAGVMQTPAAAGAAAGYMAPNQPGQMGGQLGVGTVPIGAAAAAGGGGGGGRLPVIGHGGQQAGQQQYQQQQYQQQQQGRRPGDTTAGRDAAQQRGAGTGADPRGRGGGQQGGADRRPATYQSSATVPLSAQQRQPGAQQGRGRGGEPTGKRQKGGW